MPSFDSYGNFRGTFLGADRLANTTPSPDASEPLRPFLPVSYPAPWLPIRRRNEAHPIAAGVVLSEGYLVGVDKSGALIPAGYRCGIQPNGALRAVTNVTVAGGVATLAAPSTLYAVGEQVTIAGGTGGEAVLNGVHTVTASSAGSLSFATTSGNILSTAVANITVQSNLGGDYQVIVYSQYDVGSVTNAQTGNLVSAAGQYVLLAAPADAASGDQITLPNGTVITITGGDLTFSQTCNLIPGGSARAIGYAVRDVFSCLGGIQVSSTTGGIKYQILTQHPELMQVTNYMHEPGTAIQTHFVLRLPWIGATPTTLTTLTTNDGMQGYTQTDFSRSYVHFTGTRGDAAGNFFFGCSVVPSSAGHGTDAGHYAPFNPAVNNADDIVGKCLGVELMYPIRDYADRVRTQFDRAFEFVGPRMDPNPATFQMGGSATKGLDFAITLSTNGAFPRSVAQNLPQHDEYSTYVLVHVNCR